LVSAAILFQRGYNGHGFYALSNYFYQNDIKYHSLLHQCWQQPLPFNLTAFVQVMPAEKGGRADAEHLRDLFLRQEAIGNRRFGKVLGHQAENGCLTVAGNPLGIVRGQDMRGTRMFIVLKW
jgi:hypothetical protein